METKKGAPKRAPFFVFECLCPEGTGSVQDPVRARSRSGGVTEIRASRSRA